MGKRAGKSSQSSQSKGASGQKATLDANTRLCVLHGRDDMQKRQALQSLRDALEAAHGEIEQFTYDGKRAELAEVLDELRSYSLMQTFKLVIVDEADQFVKTHRAALERYAESPVDHAALVLRSTNWNKGNLDKKIAKVGAVMKCDEPSPEHAQQIMRERAQSAYGCTLRGDAATALVDRLGPDLMQLETALGKLALMTDSDGVITPELVTEQVGRSSEEQAYMVQEAVLQGLLRGTPRPMIAKVHELVDVGGQPEVLVGYFVADVVRKLNVALMMQAAGAPQGQIMKQVRVFGDRVRPFSQVLQRVDPAQAARLFDDVLSADARAKSGLGETVRNLEAFCVRLTDNVK